MLETNQTLFFGAAFLGLALLCWIGVGLYGVWRAGRMSDRATSLQDLADFLDVMLKTDHRTAIWLWPDGRLQADPSALDALGLPKDSVQLDDLVVSEGGGIPKETIETIKAGVSQGLEVATPIMIDTGADAPRLIIDLQWLPSKDARWPSGIMWVEQSLDRTVGPVQAGSRALELRMRDLVSIFQSLPFPAWIRSQDFKLVEVNAAYVDAVDGERADAVIEQGLELFGYSGAATASKAVSDNTQTQGRSFGVVDGQRRAFNVFNAPIDNDGGTMGIAVDVTGEEEALAELSRMLESQSETLNRLRSPVAIFGPSKTLRFYNSAFTRLSGVSEDRLANGIRHDELLDAMHERRRVPEQANFRQWKEDLLRQYTTLLEPFEEMWHLPDGTTFRIVTQPHPFGGLLVLFEDVTDRLALERSYNTLIAVQRETLDNISESIAVFGTGGRLELYNPSFATIWKLEPDFLESGPHVTELLASAATFSSTYGGDDDTTRDLVAWIAARQFKTGTWYRNDGLVIEYTVVPLPDGGVMLSQRDLTDSYKVESALRERSMALEAADKLKSEFITNMSYELRTPLNSIIGFTELLDQRIFGDLNDQQASYIKDILSASADLKQLISDVLDLAVIESGDLELEFAETSVADAVREAASVAQELAIRAAAKLTINIEQDNITILADTGRLKQALYNMMSSMLSFSRARGELSIDLMMSDAEVHIRMVNLNTGLPDDERDQLLSTFSRGGNPGARRATGLDLALVRSIVGLHKGRMGLTGVGESGLSLSCYIPLDPTTARDF